MPTPTSSGLTARTKAQTSGGRLVATDGTALPLTGTSLRSEAHSGIARTTLEQRFRNTCGDALTVTYLVPLPAEGAVSGFTFRIGEHLLKGQIESRSAARETYAKALVEGRTAALLEAERDDVFTQEIGNIPPGVEVVAEITIDQPLRWLSEGAWEWRFPCVVAPRYMGEEGRVKDVERVTVDVSETPLKVRSDLVLLIRDALTETGIPSSSSHEIRSESKDSALAVTAGDIALDRDIVIRWPVARREIGMTLDVGRPGADRLCGDAAYGVLTIVPPLAEAATPRFARDLIVLLDTSGSMTGEPLMAARVIVAALIESLDECDSLELIAFSSSPERWNRGATRATRHAKQDALRWLAQRAAGGGTELRTAVIEALAGLRSDAERQIILVTDGLVGFETEIVASVLSDLPAGSHLHMIGIGPAPNRSLTTAAARAGRGIEVLAPGRGEDPVEATRRILEATCDPLLADVVLDGSALLQHAPERIPDLLGANPALIAVKLRPEGGELIAHGRTLRGTWRARVEVAPIASGAGNAAVPALFAREAIRDLEMRRAGGAPASIDETIEKLGLWFQIGTRRTSWVAVADNAVVDPTKPLRHETMPHNLPAGLVAPGLGLARKGRTVGRVKWFAEAQGYGLTAQDSVDFAARRGEGFEVLKDAEEVEFARHVVRHDTPLIGRIVGFTKGFLVVEVEIQAEMDWGPSDIEVFFPDGTSAATSVIEDRSTGPGRIAPGMTVRLSLRLPESLDPLTRPTSIMVSQGRKRFRIQLREP